VTERITSRVEERIRIKKETTGTNRALNAAGPGKTKKSCLMEILFRY